MWNSRDVARVDMAGGDGSAPHRCLPGVAIRIVKYTWHIACASQVRV